MKLFRWLRSRPLARVRRTLATKKRIRRIEALYRQQDTIIDAVRRGEYPAWMHNAASLEAFAAAWQRLDEDWDKVGP